MSGSLWWWLRGLAEDVRKLALQAAVSFFFCSVHRQTDSQQCTFDQQLVCEHSMMLLASKPILTY